MSEITKAFWGMNLNMAAQNIQTALQYLSGYGVQREIDQLEIGQLEDISYEKLAKSKVFKILKAQGNEANTPLQDRLMKRIGKIFPLMRLLRQYRNEFLWKQKENSALSPAEFAEIFLGYIQQVINLRNCFSHSFHESPQASFFGEQIGQLNALFDAALNKTKTRFYTEDDEKRFLKKYFRRYDGIEKVRDPADSSKTIKRAKANPNFKFALTNDPPKSPQYLLNDTGLLFFISLFLEKKYVSLMVDQFDKLPSSDAEKAKKRIFLILAAHLPRPRLECGETLNRETLGMEILNYLHKAPDEVFEMMTPKQRESLRFFSDDGETETLMRRSGQDQFPQLALSYLDIAEKFDSLRFMIDHGLYYFDCYQKNNLIDGSSLSERRLGKRLFSFQRIQDARRDYLRERSQTPSLYWQPQEGQTPPAEYRIDMMPKYHLKENTIGLAFAPKEGGIPVPALNQKKTRGRRPDAWLSLYELPMLLFLAGKGKAAEAEALIRQKIQGWEALLNDLEKGERPQISSDSLTQTYGLVQSDLPKDLVRYLETGKLGAANEKAAEAKAVKRLEELIERTRRTQKAFQDEQGNRANFRLGKKRVRRFGAGRIASILTRELVAYQPSNAKKNHQGKITSPNFAVLQSSLARFDSLNGSIRDIFKKSGLINNPFYPHPFLEKLLAENGALNSLSDFFDQYLRAKIYYLRGLLMKPDKRKKSYLLRHYFRAGSGMEAYIQNLRRSGFCLPRNLFADLIEKTVRGESPEQFQAEQKRAQEKGRQLNSSYMIALSQQYAGDQYQWFYDPAKRSPAETVYKDLIAVTGKNPLADQKKSRKTIASDVHNLQKRESLLRKLEDFDSAEKSIRFSKTQDTALLLAVKELLSILNPREIRLGDIKEGRHLLNQMKEFRLTMPLTKLKGRPQAGTFDVTLTGKMKLKNFGNYQRILNDLRTASLLRLFYQWKGQTEFDIDKLERELDDFDRSRKEIWEWVFRLEQTAVQKLGEENFKKSQGNYINFSDILGKLNLPREEAWTLLFLRNGFAHHFYPEFIIPDHFDLVKANLAGVDIPELETKMRALTLDSFHPQMKEATKNLRAAAVFLFDKVIRDLKK